MRRFSLGLLILVALTLAGCSAGPKQLSQDAAEARVESAVQALASTFSSDPASDDLRKMTMESEGEGAGGSAETTPFGMGAFSLTMEWGRDGVLKVSLSGGGSGVSISFTVYCGPEGTVMVLGEESYGSRPLRDGEPCEDLDGEEGAAAGLSEIVPTEDLDLDDAEVTPHADGTVTAVVTDAEGTTTITIDAAGRLTRVVVDGAGESEGTHATLTFEYGRRSDIDVPEADHLIPATLATEEEFNDASHTLTVTVTRSPEEPLLEELELRVLDGFGGEPYATWAMDTGRGEAGNVAFAVDDADGDGRLSVGDSYSLSNAEWEWSFDATHVVYDLLADGEVNSGFSEIPSPAWLVLVALALAGVASRRRR
ncbi:MAG: hypothetical protein WC876_10685 [Candidatus Thermoplasmatota archaeon]|jgi:hypothetical protein